MLRIHQVKCELSHRKVDLEKKIYKKLKVQPKEILNWKVTKRSIDARHRQIQIIYTLDVEVIEEKKVLSRLTREQKTGEVSTVKEEPYHFPKPGARRLKNRPVIVGMGPAGLFAGLLLAEHGYRPILLERGREVERRAADVEAFWRTGRLEPNSNVQFGEGGAGTFSDGKLNTLVKDTFGRNKKVLETFVQAGAPEEILYWNKPHIGTDVLKEVVKNIRERILANGGEIRFETRVSDLLMKEKNGRKYLEGLVLEEEEQLACEVCAFAIGHSARDTFSMLYERGISMRAKAFAIGIRMEHPQHMINLAQYGRAVHPDLPAADYKLTGKASNGRGVYSFCMCPGGYVVNASSEPGHLAVNGMSYHDRAGENANSAIIVTVGTEDFGSEHPLAGIEFQRQLEEAAYLEGNGRIPLQLYRDFKENRLSDELGEVHPCIKGEYTFANLRNILPNDVNKALLDGIQQFGKKLKGFDRDDALLEGVESRTSSPVRIDRDDEMESNISGLYPCGEGAGYAGGITSAAMDGIKTAEAIAKKYAPI